MCLAIATLQYYVIYPLIISTVRYHYVSIPLVRYDAAMKMSVFGKIAIKTHLNITN